MARFRASLPSIYGMVGPHDGVARTFLTLVENADADRLDVALLDVDAQNVTVTVTDGTTPVQATITAGQKYASASVSASWTAGAVLTMTVTAPGGDGMNLTGSLSLDSTG